MTGDASLDDDLVPDDPMPQTESVRESVDQPTEPPVTPELDPDAEVEGGTEP